MGAGVAVAAVVVAFVLLELALLDVAEVLPVLWQPHSATSRARAGARGRVLRMTNPPGSGAASGRALRSVRARRMPAGPEPSSRAAAHTSRRCSSLNTRSFCQYSVCAISGVT